MPCPLYIHRAQQPRKLGKALSGRASLELRLLSLRKRKKGSRQRVPPCPIAFITDYGDGNVPKVIHYKDETKG